MIAYTQANTAKLSTTVTAKPQTWDKRNRAQAAAVKTIGPHAREGFEFETFKCDGRWGWRATDGTRPENHAQLKANGGKRSLLAQAVAIEAKGGTAPKEMLAKAFEEVTDPLKRKDINDAAAAGVKLGQFRKETDTLAGEAVAAAAIAKMTADKVAKELKGTPAESLAQEIADKAEERLVEARRGTKENPTRAQKLMLEDGAPESLVFAKMPETAEAAKARVERLQREMGPNRKIRNPPDAGKAKAKAQKEKKTSIAFVAKSAIMAGKDNTKALADVLSAFPTCGYKESDVQWYRRKLVKEGKLKDGSAKPSKVKK